MPTAHINYLGDPWNSDAIATPKRCKSAYYSGTYTDLTAPAAANFPEDDTSKTRYTLALPFVPHSNLTTYPLVLRDGTTSTVLTRVTGAPGTNEFRIAPSTSKRPHVVELHSGQAGHTINFDGYAIGCVLDAEDIVAQYKTSAGVISNRNILTRIIEIGDWNMDSTDEVTLTISDIDYTNFVGMTAIIISDDDVFVIYSTIERGGYLLGYFAGSSVFVLHRTTGGAFDNADYNKTSYNRGYAILRYKE